jgi:hypothetical protein
MLQIYEKNSDIAYENDVKEKSTKDKAVEMDDTTRPNNLICGFAGIREGDFSLHALG